MSRANEPAFPVHPETNPCGPSGGLSKREYFAAMAMQGLLAEPSERQSTTEHRVAAVAVRCADALIAALEEEPTP